MRLVVQNIQSEQSMDPPKSSSRLPKLLSRVSTSLQSVAEGLDWGGFMTSFNDAARCQKTFSVHRYCREVGTAKRSDKQCRDDDWSCLHLHWRCEDLQSRRRRTDLGNWSPAWYHLIFPQSLIYIISVRVIRSFSYDAICLYFQRLGYPNRLV